MAYKWPLFFTVICELPKQFLAEIVEWFSIVFSIVECDKNSEFKLFA